MLVRGLSVVLLFILILQQCVVIRGSTLVREDMPGSEMSGAEFGYNPRSTKGRTSDKIENRKYHTIRTILQSNIKTTERVDVPNIKIHHRSLSWLGTGPIYWTMKWPSCSFSMQSPIDINTTFVTYDRPYKIRYNQENQQLPGDVLNNGHTTAFYFEEKARYLYGVPGAPKDKFLLNELHFHFGNDRVHGSEHSINGQFFPVEVHLVHYNSKYRTPKMAAMMTDGIVTIAVFLEIRRGPKNHVDTFMKRYLPRVIKPEGPKVKGDLNPSLLLPFKRDFYTYRGSVTVPPCRNNIRWLIMKEKRSISVQAYRALLMLKSKEGEPISKYGNFRPLQGSSCNRFVEANFKY